jgi:allantoinase
MSDRPARFALASSRIVTPEGVRGGAVLMADGKIEAVVSLDELPIRVPVEDLGGLVISPGLVDAHVHINEPGRTEWEGFETATRAAAAGGVTTLVDMPLNSTPVTTTVDALYAKRQAAAGKCWVDVGFYGGLVEDNAAEIGPLLDAGVCGVKAFLCHSGLYDFPAVGEAELRQALPILARRGVPLLVHAEIVDDDFPTQSPRSYRDWEWMRPDHFEWNAIELLERLCREFMAPIHVVHLSAGISTHTFQSAKNRGLPLTVETCPHYLHFSSEDLQGADTRFKCAPPIRRRDDRERLWNALISAVIDTIGSDHSPCPPEMKCLETNDWQRAWGGISSLQLTLPIVWRGACSRMVPLARLAEWLSSHPARLVGLDDRKGRIAAGFDADLCVWDPAEEWTVRGEELQHRHKVTAYEGELLLGRVKRTYVRGGVVYDDSEFPARPIGQLLRRGN